jgi:antitoxin component YwqK of YwqJK toxin-antitoxin module
MIKLKRVHLKGLTILLLLTVFYKTNAQPKQVSITYWQGTKVKKVEYEYLSGSAGKVGNITTRDPKTGLIKERDLNTYSINSMTPHGFWKEYNENGSLEREFQYDHGARHGVAKVYYENGSPEVVYNYNNNVIDGEFTEYHENGKTLAKCTYSNGKRIGASTFYDESGNVISYFTYYEPTETGNYAGAGEKEMVAKALYQTKYPNGKIKEEGYLASKYSGDRYPDSYYYDGFQRQGVFKSYDENGIKTEESTFKGGYNNGLKTTFYPNGKKKEETTYAIAMIEGNPVSVVDGPYKAYYENGQVDKAGIMKSLVTKSNTGELEMELYNSGDWRKYNESGKLIQFMSFGKGNEVICEMDEKAIDEQSALSEKIDFPKYKSAMANKFTKYFRFHYGGLIDDMKGKLPSVMDPNHPNRYNDNQEGYRFQNEIEKPAMIVFNQYLSQLKSCDQTVCAKEYSEKLDNIMQKLYHLQNVKEVADKLQEPMVTIQDVLKI